MSDNYEKEEYIIDRKRREIVMRAVLSNKQGKGLAESEVKALVYEDEAKFFVCAERDTLVPVDLLSLRNDWEKHYRGHITTGEEEKNSGDFENGYFYIAQLWKMKFGRKLVVLYYHH